MYNWISFLMVSKAILHGVVMRKNATALLKRIVSKVPFLSQELNPSRRHGGHPIEIGRGVQ
ncbi:MAG: hypothetical protein NWE87_06405 [Candidatus Bathyarchaeota archaeon]|nr:hypothetical protein [Candidatus Bathyarchaeota archaeon]